MSRLIGRTLLLALGVTISIAFAFTNNTRAETYSHTAWSPDWGTKPFNYTAHYMAAQYGITELFNHEVDAYKTPDQVIWPPEVGNGDVLLLRVYLQGSDEVTYDEIQGNSFSNGAIYDHIYPGGTLHYFTKYNYSAMEGSSMVSLTGVAELWFMLDSDAWFPNLWTDYAFRYFRY